MELPKTRATVGTAAAELRVRSRKARPPGMNSSAWAGRSAPPDSTRLMTGRRFCRAMSEARAPLRKEKGFMAPPRTVGSWARDEALDPLDHADADDRGRPDRVLGAPGGQGAQLEEGGVPVEQELDPLAGQQLAPLLVPGHVALAAAGPGRGQLLVDLVDGLGEGALRWPGRLSEFGSMVVARTGMGGRGRRGRRACGAGGPAGRIARADVGRIGP